MFIYSTTNTILTNIGNNFKKEKEKKTVEFILTQKHKVSQNWAHFSPPEPPFSISISVPLSLFYSTAANFPVTSTSGPKGTMKLLSTSPKL